MYEINCTEKNDCVVKSLFFTLHHHYVIVNSFQYNIQIRPLGFAGYINGSGWDQNSPWTQETDRVQALMRVEYRTKITPLRVLDLNQYSGLSLGTDPIEPNSQQTKYGTNGGGSNEGPDQILNGVICDFEALLLAHSPLLHNPNSLSLNFLDSFFFFCWAYNFCGFFIYFILITN